MVGGGAAGTPATGGFVAATRARGAEHRVTGLAEQQLLQKNIKIYFKARQNQNIKFNADPDPAAFKCGCRSGNSFKILEKVTL